MFIYLQKDPECSDYDAGKIIAVNVTGVPQWHESPSLRHYRRIPATKQLIELRKRNIIVKCFYARGLNIYPY